MTAAQLLAGTGFLALGLSPVLPWPLTALALALTAVSWRLRAHPSPAGEATRRLALAVLSVAAAGAFVVALSDAARLSAAAAAAFWGALVLLFVADGHATRLFAALAALAQLAIAATLTESLWFGALVVAVIALGPLTLTAACVSGGAACGAARLFLARRRHGGPRAPVARRAASRGEARAASRLIVRVTAITLASTLLLFFVIPRYGAGYFFRRKTDEGPERAVAFSDRVDFGAVGKMMMSTRVAMRVELMNRSGPQPGILRWRGVALDHFDGRVWSATRGRGSVLADLPRGFRESDYFINAPLRQPPDVLRQRVFLAEDSGVLFGATRIMRFWGKFTRVEVSPDDSILVRFPEFGSKHYVCTSDASAPSPDELRAATGPRPDWLLRRYLQLPGDLSPAVVALARRIGAGSATDLDRVVAVERFLAKSCRYVHPLDEAAGAAAGGPRPLERFLLETRTGHCSHFAAGMAVLLRALSVPARVVNGYIQGDYSEVGGYYIVTDQDAHGWVEVHFPRHGWVAFDPTPAGELRVLHAGGRRAKVWLYLDAALMLWRRYVIDYHLLDQVEHARSLLRFLWPARERSERSPMAVADAAPTAGPAAPGRLSPLVMFLVALAAALAWLLLALRRRAAAAPAPSPVAGMPASVGFYARLLALLARHGLARRPSQTASELARAVAAVRPGVAAAVGEMTGHYLRVRFGDGASSPADEARLERLLADVGRALRDAAPPG
jgi:transglutaminase-like putative cysteine protease